MKTTTVNLLKNLFDLVQRLYNGERLSVKDIAEIYNLNYRTAQRYPKYLEAIGIDIRKTKEGKKVIFYIKLPAGAESIVDVAKKLNLSIPIIDKLKTSVYYSKLDIEKVDLSKLEILEEAIKNKNKLEIIYEKFEGKIQPLTDVKPLKIANFEGYWYLLALNYENEYRRYHINSMKNIKILEDTFFIDNEFLDKVNKKAVNVWYDPFKEPYLVELYLDEVATKFFKRAEPFKPFNVKEESDGSSIVSVEITHDMEILPFILRWLPHVKVLSPERLNNKVKAHIKNY